MNRDEELIEAAEDIAEESYDPSDYGSGSTAEKGLAVTHEQASDDYMEGNNGGKIEKNGARENLGMETSHTGYGYVFPDQNRTR
ncbi:YozQ family protein [Brevibacillus sp. TJ4]|uniref:YozQ family protein n=1 Tax=Brevibacillus sp. TJ4 TaxID=3234853 RepID=UPI0037D3D480